MVSKRIKEKEEGSEEVIEEKTKKVNKIISIVITHFCICYVQQQHNDSEDEFSSVGGSDDGMTQ